MELGGGCGGRAQPHRHEVGGQQGQGGLTGWRERLQSEAELRPDLGERGGESGLPRLSQKTPPATASWQRCLVLRAGLRAHRPSSRSPSAAPRLGLTALSAPHHQELAAAGQWARSHPSFRSPLGALHRRHGLWPRGIFQLHEETLGCTGHPYFLSARRRRHSRPGHSCMPAPTISTPLKALPEPLPPVLSLPKRPFCRHRLFILQNSV